MKKTTITFLLTSALAGTIYANECLDSLNKYNEYSDLAKDAKTKAGKQQYKEKAMKSLKKVSNQCDHLKEEERNSINQELSDYYKK